MDDEETVRLKYTYKITKDINRVKNYGLALAKCVRLPASLLQRADALVEQIQDDSMVSVGGNKNTTSRSNVSLASRGRASLNETMSTEMPKVQRDCCEIFSMVQTLMSQGNRSQSGNSAMQLDQIVKRIDVMINNMTPRFRSEIEQSSCGDIIAGMNSTMVSNSE